jgi:hypothetical protein
MCLYLMTYHLNMAQKSENDALELLKSARDIAFLFAVFLYFMGWIYIYFFLDKFGLSVKAVDVDLYNLLIYSSNIFIYLYHNHLFILLLATAAVLFVLLFKKTAPFVIKLFPVIIILLFPLTFYLAKITADASSQAILNDPKLLGKVSFIFKDVKADATAKSPALPEPLSAANNFERVKIFSQSQAGSFRLLVANKDEYYVLQYTPHYSNANPAIEYALITK